MAVLEVNGLSAGYGKSLIVRDVALSADAGAVLSIVGPNGAGKSTLLKAVAGLLPRTGSITISEKDVSKLPTEQLVRSGLSYVPQVRNIFPTLSVYENMEMGGYTRREDLAPLIDKLFTLFPDLRAASRKEAGKLSGGQRTLLGMARSLMLEPKVLLLDEPTAGVAPIYVDQVWESISVIADQGTAVVVVEQNVDRAIAHSSRVQVLVAGETRMVATPAELESIDLAGIFLGSADVPGEPRQTNSPE